MSKERFEELAYNVGISLDGEKALMSSDDYDFLYNYALQQAERVQKLENKLENVMDRHTYLEGDYYDLQKQNERYRVAIRECIERMNEGGAGTRSFVYEKLIEALEESE